MSEVPLYGLGVHTNNFVPAKAPTRHVHTIQLRIHPYNYTYTRVHIHPYNYTYTPYNSIYTLTTTQTPDNVKRFRGGLLFEAHRLLDHSTLGLRVIKKKKDAVHLNHTDTNFIHS